mmetsp:Transcript_15408/g.51722  ORF Transcript_15408/g.51722 Transcript_15408/m.51722 type:complete len:216 (-) Transcript_15408:112-759(-)
MEGMVGDLVLLDVFPAVLKGPESDWVHLLLLPDLERCSFEALISSPPVDPEFGLTLSQSPKERLDLRYLVVGLDVFNEDIVPVLLIKLLAGFASFGLVDHSLESVKLLNLLKKFERLRKEMQRVDEDNLHFRKQTRLVQDVQDDVVPRNQRGREHGILVLRYCKNEIVNSLLLEIFQPRLEVQFVVLLHEHIELVLHPQDKLRWSGHALLLRELS